MTEFSHLDDKGKPAMVDVSSKESSLRTASASTIILLPDEVTNKLIEGDLQTKKGSVFQTAVIAGIMAAKKTGELIPLCHSLGLDNCHINISVQGQNELLIEC